MALETFVILTGLLLPFAAGQELTTETGGYTEGCGRATSRAVKTPPYSSPSPLGSSPWNTVVYRLHDTTNEWKFSCCGNIIAPNIVLTAASCVFVEQLREFVNASFVRVIAAKTHASINQTDENAQQRYVKKIYFPELFKGEITGFIGNLAVLYTELPFSLNDFVMPVCIDWVNGIIKNHGLGQSSSENVVEVAGFGLGSNSFQQNGELQEGSFVVQRNRECRLDKRKPNMAKLRGYIGYDKFCILTPFGTIKSDFGSGLVVQVGNRFYLQGIMSTFLDETFSVATNITYHKAWLRGVMSDIEAEGKCKDGFLCGNHVCIPKSKRCDRVTDCEDKSDENDEMCGYKVPHTKPVKTQMGCTLPIQLGGASYRLENCVEGPLCTRLAGTMVDDGQTVHITCGRWTTPSERGPRYACLNGEWFQETPKCAKMCPPRELPGVEVTCDYNGGDVNCSDYMKPGTKAVATCKRLYKLKDPLAAVERSKCLSNGKWSAELPSCLPECGVPNLIDNVTPTITFGKNATYGRYPWHTALYKKNSTSQLWEQICSGTILFPTNMILTAAHCVHDADSNPVNVENLLVAGGKVMRELTHRETYQQVSRVKEVIVPEEYEGFTTRYVYDIALIDLVTPFNITDFVLPCCVDYQSTTSLLPTSDATVVGWGYTEERLRQGVSGISSKNLLEAQLPLISNHECRSRDNNFKTYVTFDKFCGIYRNGSGPQRGDSGGGVIVPHGEQYFVIGVISIKPTYSEDFGAFTSVGKHQNWIRDVIRTHLRWNA